MLAACAATQEPLPRPAPAAAEQVRQLAAPSVVSLIGFGLDRSADELYPVGQGSAIAVTAHTFLTDCRNLVGADAVVLSSGRQQGLAYLDPEYYGDDVCVLRSQELVGKPVHAARDAGDVRPGEQVYAVADPEGLGPVLQAAALTGTRRDSGIAWLQTTAAVTTGWPGAAVFDTQGNLLGVAIRPRGIAGQQVVAFTQDSPLIPTTLARADDRRRRWFAAAPHRGPARTRRRSGQRTVRFADIAAADPASQPRPVLPAACSRQRQSRRGRLDSLTRRSRGLVALSLPGRCG